MNTKGVEMGQVLCQALAGKQARLLAVFNRQQAAFPTSGEAQHEKAA